MTDLLEVVSNPAALAALVATITAFIKARLNVHGNVVIILAIVVSASLVGLAGLAEQFPAQVELIVTIIMGAFAAGGAVDVVKDVKRT